LRSCTTVWRRNASEKKLSGGQRRGQGDAASITTRRSPAHTTQPTLAHRPPGSQDRTFRKGDDASGAAAVQSKDLGFHPGEPEEGGEDKDHDDPSEREMAPSSVTAVEPGAAGLGFLPNPKSLCQHPTRPRARATGRRSGGVGRCGTVLIAFHRPVGNPKRKV
jgi:hypothetical protein